MIRYYFIFLFLFSIGGGKLWSQTDIVVLPDGNEVIGVLKAFAPGDSVVLAVEETGEIRRFAEGEYLRVLQLDKRKVSLVPGDLETLQQVVEEVEDEQVILHFQNGSKQKGRLLSYEPTREVVLQVSQGAILHYEPDKVIAITYDGGKELTERYRSLAFRSSVKPDPVYAFREQGLFQHTSFAFTFGKSQVRTSSDTPIFFPGPEDPEVRTTGFNVQHLLGYQFNRYLGLGLGIGFDAYNIEGGEGMLSVFAHYRAYLTNSIRAPYVGLSAGYGFPVLAKDQGFREHEGGLLFHPELGMRLGASEKANFTIGLGYKWQSAYYVQDEEFSRVILYRDMVYRRLVFNLGLLF